MRRLARMGTVGTWLLGALALSGCNPGAAPLALLAQNRFGVQQVLEPPVMPPLAHVDERFQSYNLGMRELTGARVALDDVRLRRLAAALGPAYLRVSGPGANATYFPPEGSKPTVPPAGFEALLSRRQWRGLVDFAKAVDARIVTSFAVSAGTRDAGGVWTPEQARWRLDYSVALGAPLAAVEFMHEPNLARQDGAPADYDAAAYGRDFRRFRAFVKRAAPGLPIIGPGSVGESEGGASPAGHLGSAALLAAAGPGLALFSFHQYGTAPSGCSGARGLAPGQGAEALSEDWLARPERSLAFYRQLRDRFAPGRPLWLGASADAPCGGTPQAATFLDSFRYLDLLGRMARAGVQVVMHDGLVGGASGLLDERTLEPRPDYWAALLWHRLMGATVLDPGGPPPPGVQLYAHCLRDKPGGVAVLAINTERERARALALPVAAERYTLAADGLQSRTVRLNRQPLALVDGELPALTGGATEPGYLFLRPATITFLAIEQAGNAACR